MVLSLAPESLTAIITHSDFGSRRTNSTTGGNLNDPIVFKSSNARALPAGMLKSRVDRRNMATIQLGLNAV